MPKPRLIGHDDDFDRQIWLVELDDLHAPLDWDKLQNEKFVCVCAINASSISNDEISAFCSRLIDLGCAYFCAWGPDCERVHDIMDGVFIGDRPPDTDTVLMTTWHAKKSLAEVINFFLTCTVPDEEFAPDGCSYGLAIVIGSDDWATQIEQHVREMIVAPAGNSMAKSLR